MDYYSGAPEPNDYNINNSYNNGGFGNFFRKNSVLILIVLALVIVALVVVFVLISRNNKTNYEQLDDDSYLSELSVDGGNIEPSFSKKTLKYIIYADSDYVSFSCKASSKKAKIEGCDEKVELTKDEVEYNIKVTAEDKNITRYYFTIVKSEKIEDEFDNDVDISVDEEE